MLGGATGPSNDPIDRGRGGHLRFLGPLHELCAIGLYRPALEALAEGSAPDGAPPIDQAYLLKVLEEEVARPFGHPLRPVLELILNGIDASHDFPRIVDVTAGAASVEVDDAGEGMSLRTILSRLLLPFATDKIAGVDVGRFGVGFFSVLGFGLADPDSFSLHVETGDGHEGWSIRVVAGGPDAASLTASVREIDVVAPGRARGLTGTRVRVESALLDPESVRAYVIEALHFFPPERALVRLDGVPINDGSAVSGGRLYEDAAGPGLRGRFHLGGRGLRPGITAATYHAGVRVEACCAIGDLALIDFPGTVELTEGRDALKPGPTFTAVVTAFHRRLARVANEAEDARVRPRVAELAAQISALMLKSQAWGEIALELAQALLGEGRHLLGPDRAEAVLGFLGAGAADRVFVPESFWAEREWHGYLPGEGELLDDELSIEPPEPLASLARRRPDLGGLETIVARTENPAAMIVALAHGRRRAAGPLPFLGTRRALLIHADAPAVRAPRGWIDLYALRAAFDRAAGVRETDVERDLIVASPIGLAARQRSARKTGGSA